MATVSVTLRLRLKYFESTPIWQEFEQMQVNKIEFHIMDTAGDRLTIVDVPITRDGRFGDYISASVQLEQNTDYKAVAFAFSPFHPNGVESVRTVEFNSGDATAYYNFEGVVVNKNTLVPIVGATVTYDLAGVNIVRTTRENDGLFWIQRLPAGVKTLSIAAAGYTTLNTTVDVSKPLPVYWTLVPL